MKGAIFFAILLIVLAGQSEGIWISRVMPQKFWKKIIDDLDALRGDEGEDSLSVEERTKMNLPKMKFYKDFFANAGGSRIERKDESGQSTRDFYLRNIRAADIGGNHHQNPQF
eukprot:13932.XXX_475727_476306_1 [CDS] Oithona nana genome sequencing.